MRWVLGIVTAVALGLGAVGCELFKDECDQWNLETPWTLNVYASGRLNVKLPGKEAKVTMYKKHCSGSLGTTMSYSFVTDAEGTLIKQGAGYWSISVTNQKETLLADWTVNGSPLVDGGTVTVSYDDMFRCQGRSLLIFVKIDCTDEELRVCRRYVPDTRIDCGSS